MTGEVRIALCDPERVLLEEIADAVRCGDELTDDAAQDYAAFLSDLATRLSEGTGESERTRLWDALRLLAITHFDHERLITDENFDCTELFESGLVKHIEIGGCGEKSCTLTAEGMEAIQEALDLDLSPDSRLSVRTGRRQKC